MSPVFTRAGFSLFTCVLLFSLSVSLNAGRLDPLTDAEINNALQLQQPVNIQARSAFQAASDTVNSNRKETLLTERHQAAKQETARLADVYVYDYDTNELEQTVINLDTGTVVSRNTSQGVQLPLTDTEIHRAGKLVMNDDEEFALIQSEYQRITGQILTSIDQLEIKAFTFYADSLPLKVNQASSQCGVHRCAQMLIYTPDNIVFEISPIIDLSTNLVTQNIGF